MFGIPRKVWCQNWQQAKVKLGGGSPDSGVTHKLKHGITNKIDESGIKGRFSMPMRSLIQCNLKTVCSQNCPFTPGSWRIGTSFT